MTAGEFRPTGRHDHADAATMRNASERMALEVTRARDRGEHYWIAVVGYVVTPPLGDGLVLDRDNLRVPPEVGCYVCEQPYRRASTSDRCPGDP